MRLVVAALLVLLAAVPAHGQGGATVARNGGVELQVRDDQDEREGLCLDLRLGEEDTAGSCGSAPTTRMSSLTLSGDSRSRRFIGGAVPAGGTFEVELEFARGEKVRARTVEGEAYTGQFTGKLAFFLAETTGAQRAPSPDGDGDDPVLIRRFDAQGNLIGASSGAQEEGPTIAGPKVIERVGDVTVRAVARREFAPSVIQLDRTETMVCLSLDSPRGGGSGTCTGAGGPAILPLLLSPERTCRRGMLVTGFAGPEVRTVELTLGNGRRVRTGTLDVSSLGTPARAVVVLVKPGQAVRSARALDAAGKVVDTQVLAAAPVPRRCGYGLTGWLALYGGIFDPPPSAEPGQVVTGSAPGPRLVAREEGDLLCLGIDGFGADGHQCLLPPPEDEYPQPIERRTAAYSAVAGLVPAGAATVTAVFEGGQRVAATISEGGEYGGRYRGHVRFYLAHAGAGKRLERVETHDAAGNLFSSIPGEDGGTGEQRTVHRGRGYRIVGTRFDVRFKLPGERAERFRGTCVALAFGGRAPDLDHCSPVEQGLVLGEVSCSPHRGVLIGQMTEGLRGVRFELRGGGRIDARVVRVPKRLGGGRIWVLDVPPGARVARLRYLGKMPKERFTPQHARVRPYPLPAPRRQCGYLLDITF